MTLPTHYRKLVAVRPDPDLHNALDIQTVQMTPPQAGELVVQTHYAGVNAADYLMAQGRYLAPTPPPHDMGSETVGVVVAVGEGVTGFAAGDAVLSLSGGFRDYFTVPARHAVPIPQAIPEVVTLGVSGLTASIALDITGEMTTGETVLVTAAAGGTGSFAVQLAKHAGNHVIGTCGSDDKAAFLASIGCDRPINYRTENLREVLANEYAQGVDIVFDGVGGEMYDAALDHLAVRGRLIVIGAISEYERGPQRVNRARVSYKLLSKSASIRGFWLMHYLRQMGEHTQKLLSLVQSGALTLAIDPTPFAGIAGTIAAIEHLYEGKNIGKVVVDFTL